MAPLALMVVISGLYSSIQSKRIDTRYSELLDQDVRTLKNLTRAKALAALFGQLLYTDIAEMNPDKLHMFPEATYTSLQLPVQAEDRVVLYTDGIPETKSPSEQEFGTARFIKFMENNRSLAVDHFADGLLDELSRWSEQPRGQGQQDDITVLTIDFK